MKVTKELLERYGKGACTPEEKKAVERWLNSVEYPSVRLSTDKRPKADSQEIWAKLSEGRPKLEKQMSLKKAKSVILFTNLKRYAAAVLILFVLGFSTYYVINKSYNVNNTPLAELYQTVQTQRGEKRTVKLPDGSTIRMNYETELRVPEKFEGDERVVYLTGHAHFDIAKNPDKPFVIYTDDSKTQVLGTSFDINTREEGETEIIVTSGRVAFSQKDKEDNGVTLTVNDRAVLKADQHIVTNTVKAHDLTAWKENRLAFYDQPFAEIIEVIEPWYDVRVSVKDTTLLSQQYTFIYDNPSLEMLMERMSKIAKFDYVIEGQNIIIE